MKHGSPTSWGGGREGSESPTNGRVGEREVGVRQKGGERERGVGVKHKLIRMSITHTSGVSLCGSGRGGKRGGRERREEMWRSERKRKGGRRGGEEERRRGAPYAVSQVQT